MYLDHFGLGTNPFSLAPKLDFLYKSGAFEESMAHLVYGLDNSEAIVMITGAIGTGKTMSLHSFLSSLGPRYHSALVTNTQVDPVGFLKLVLEDLEIPFPPGCDKADLLILFKEFLLEANRQRRRVIVVVDEAQNLSTDVLEEVRLLTNLGQGDLQPVQVILVGQPELEDRVNEPGLAQLRQRIRVHYRLQTLSRDELGEYLDHRMAVAGCAERVFSTRAVDRIFELSGGVPRLINSLAGGALLSAYVADRRRVEAADVEDPDAAREPAPAPVAAPAPAAAPPPRPEPAAAPPPPAVPPRRSAYAPRRPRRRRALGVLLALLAVLVVLVAYVAGSGRLATFLDLVQGDAAADHGVLPRDTAPARSPHADASPSAGEPGTVAPPSEPETTEAAAAVPADTRAADVPADSAAVAGAAPADTTMAAAVADSAAEPFYVHVASFQEEARARHYVRDLADAGHPAIIRLDHVFGNPWYRVWLGPFTSEAQARAEIARRERDEDAHYYDLRRAGDVPGT